MTFYKNHRDPIRSLDQVTGRNVIQFPTKPRPFLYEEGVEPPKFLTKKDDDK